MAATENFQTLLINKYKKLSNNIGVKSTDYQFKVQFYDNSDKIDQNVHL